jgi:hypothetical protein
MISSAKKNSLISQDIFAGLPESDGSESENDQGLFMVEESKVREEEEEKKEERKQPLPMQIKKQINLKVDTGQRKNESLDSMEISVVDRVQEESKQGMPIRDLSVSHEQSGPKKLKVLIANDEPM